MSLYLESFCWMELVITCLGGRFRISCPSAFLKIFKNHDGGLSKKSLEQNMWLLVDQTKPINTLY